MKDLDNILEGILDTDLDVELTIGDVYDLTLQLVLRSAEINANCWKFQEFWPKYDGIQNAWTRERHIALKNPLRTKYIKGDIRHGFIMYLLTQPAETKINQKFVDECVKHMNKMCNTTQLRLEVHVESKNGQHEFNIWNRAIKDSIKSFMGKFYLIPR